MSRLLALVVIAVVANGWAPQEKNGDSAGAKPPQNSAQQSNSSSEQNSGADATPPGSERPGSAQSNAASPPPAKTPSNPKQPPASELSHDLSFPESDPTQPPVPAPSPKSTSLVPPRSDSVQAGDLGGVGESSSKETPVDLSPPEDDAKVHPQSSAAVADAEAGVLTGNGVSEFHTWDPHKAAKSVEVGDFYFKRKNYRAAEDRYREALRYKDNDAVATIRLAVCLEKLGILDDARSEYQSYLKILPHGPLASDAQKAIDRLTAATVGGKTP